MRELPILFSAPMVRAILEGRKTVTRRIAKGVHFVHAVAGEALKSADSAGGRIPCPYGQPGDRLWVREAFGYEFDTPLGTNAPPDRVIYRADAKHAGKVGWSPSIHMPRTASRITLEVTGVRVERLQAISEDDAIAEGIHTVQIGSGYRDSYSATPVTWADAVEQAAVTHEDPRLAFRDLWESINGSGSWNVNPWVWVVEFKRVEAQKA
ncbi:hypothetical protein [Rhodanobacter thiooxydans]|uniref:hypothetical protein n=1 Tax=Rhodanobacter thiooxydans TaxID=416169 RepID=UPI000260DA19|nr:hypothetical protein [Rhodanobacter thiooxydans]EIL99106.1 hypothetical protein UUA_08871 [Rhodanobacter thiooxydans LCS2]